VDDGSDRGGLSLAPRVVTKIAELTALQVRDVVRHSDGLERLVGRRLPRATAFIDRDRVRIDLDIAVLWPCPVEELAAEVRHRVATETARLTGLQVRSTDITLHAVTHDDANGDTRRVQ